VLLQLLLSFTRVHILKVVVLVGTFALAMAFAANDLVNFIGVPLAGLSALQVASASTDPLTATMEALRQPVSSNTLLLLIAGAIMVVTLWVSRKARSVTKTEVSLGRQDEGFERFEANALSRASCGWWRRCSTAPAACSRGIPALGQPPLRPHSTGRRRPPTARCRPSTSSAPRST
jgi:hypothetical protein